MPRLLTVALAVAVVACSSGALETIEAAEAYAQARGVTLAEKTEDTEQVVASRAFDYRVGEVRVVIFQFQSSTAAARWKEMMDQSPLAPEHRIQKGAVIFQIARTGSTDAERQKVIAALSQ